MWVLGGVLERNAVLEARGVYRGWGVEACVPESELERQYHPSEMSLTYSTVLDYLSGGREVVEGSLDVGSSGLWLWSCQLTYNAGDKVITRKCVGTSFCCKIPIQCSRQKRLSA